MHYTLKIIVFSFIYTLCILNCSFAQSFSATINGIAPGSEHKTIKITSYSDYITNTEKVLSTTVIDSSGAFSMKINLYFTKYTSISIDNNIADLYIESGKNYQLQIDTLSYSEKEDNYNHNLQKYHLDYKIINTDENDLNKIIRKFNAKYNNFVLYNFQRIYKHRDKKSVDEFKEQIASEFSSINNEYLKNYIKYRIATLEMTGSLYSKNKLIHRYFVDNPVLYNNIEYFEFFRNFYKSYILNTSLSINMTDLEYAINTKSDYFLLLDYLGKDTMLFNERIRELVLLNNIVSIYYDGRFEKDKVLNILSTIKNEDKFPEHSIIAENIIHKLIQLKNGTNAPSLILQITDGESILLGDTTNKYIYMNFFKTNCKSCVLELDLMKKLYDNYKDSIQFISISFDKDFTKTKKLISEKGFNWTILHYKQKEELIEKYQIKTFPLFVFVDKSGKIIRYPAKKPSENIENTFKRMFYKAPEKQYKLFR